MNRSCFVEVASSGADRVESTVTHVESLFLTGSAAIDGAGNSLDNTVKGNSGRNNPDAQAAATRSMVAQVLIGRLVGRAQTSSSSQKYLTTHAVSARETILDFARAQYRINLSVIDANTDVAGKSNLQVNRNCGLLAYSRRASLCNQRRSDNRIRRRRRGWGGRFQNQPRPKHCDGERGFRALTRQQRPQRGVAATLTAATHPAGLPRQWPKRLAI